MLPALVSLKPREDLASMYLEEKASLWKIADKKKKRMKESHEALVRKQQV